MRIRFDYIDERQSTYIHITDFEQDGDVIRFVGIRAGDYQQEPPHKVTIQLRNVKSYEEFEDEDD